MGLEPQGEELRRAVKWISEQRSENSTLDPIRLIESACLKFDLSPRDEEFLLRFIKEAKDRKPTADA